MEAEDGFLVIGERTAIRHAAADDVADFVLLSTASAAIHDPWIFSPRSHDAYTNYLGRFDGVNALCLLICARATKHIAGFATVSGIVRQPYDRGVLGYGVFTPSAGQGYMTEGVRLIIDYCFTKLGLHRLEADIQPANARSTALAERVGMHREGFSPQFVFIKDAWRDHERWAVVDRP